MLVVEFHMKGGEVEIEISKLNEISGHVDYKLISLKKIWMASSSISINSQLKLFWNSSSE